VEGSLFGLRVLDLGLTIPASYCTAVMAGLGAEVIKIEPPEGDPSRREGPFLGDNPHPEKSGLFLYTNQGKKSVTLNLAIDTGRRMFLQLLASTDVVVESFDPGYLAGLGLGYPTLEAANPGVVLVSITPFGQDGPYKNWQGNELVDYALSGQLYGMGDPDKEPLKTGGSVTQFYGGQMAFNAALTAVLCRGLTGDGQHVDVAITEAIASMVEHNTTAYAYSGQTTMGRSSEQSRGGAQGQYLCQDGYVQITPGQGESTMDHLAQIMDLPELLDPRFATREGRIEHKAEIDRLIQPWLSRHTKLEIYQMGQERRLQFGYGCTAEDLVNSPQFQDREYFVEVDHPIAGTLRYPGAPFKLSDTPWQAQRAPLLGEHNDEVYCGRLGYTKAQLTILRTYGAI